MTWGEFLKLMEARGAQTEDQVRFWSEASTLTAPEHLFYHITKSVVVPHPIVRREEACPTLIGINTRS